MGMVTRHNFSRGIMVRVSGGKFYIIKFSDLNDHLNDFV